MSKRLKSCKLLIYYKKVQHWTFCQYWTLGWRSDGEMAG